MARKSLYFDQGKYILEEELANKKRTLTEQEAFKLLRSGILETFTEDTDYKCSAQEIIVSTLPNEDKIYIYCGTQLLFALLTNRLNLIGFNF